MYKLITIIILFTLSFTEQSIKSQPIMIFHVVGGYSLPYGNLKGSISDSFSQNYRVKNGYNLGMDFKLGIGSERQIRLVFSGSYNWFSNKSDMPVDNAGYEYITLHNVVLGAGIELAPISRGAFLPFVGADITANFFAGSDEFDVSTVNHHSRFLNPATRMGLIIGGGIDLAPLKSAGIGAVIGVKYNFANMFSKRNGSLIPAIGINYDLNDASKDISYLSLYAGLSINIGEPPKKTSNRK